MAKSQNPKPKHSTPADTTAAVNAFLAQLEHPHKTAVEAIRAAILDASPDIREGVKWNAPSYRTHEYFATTNLRAKTGVGVILHLGAKVRELPAGGVVVADPAGLLSWLAADRASVTFIGIEDFKAKRVAFVDLIRTWIRYV